MTPHKMIYPSFWAYQTNYVLSPILPDIVIPYIKALLETDTTFTIREWPIFNEQQFTAILDSLALRDSASGSAVFVSGGQVYRKDGNGKLRGFEHPAAAPYAWPIAHDVRPASQSLGVHGCEDCHSLKSPLFFSRISIPSPLAWRAGETLQMLEFSRLNRPYAQFFSLTFILRPWLETISAAVSALLVLILLIYGVRGFTFLLERMGQNIESTNPLE